MTHQTIPPAIFIKRKGALYRLADELTNEKIIAVDTESNSLYAYQEQVCLIQFSTEAQDFILDPLAFPNLDILNQVFRNADIEKIFHSAEYDLLCLNRDFGFEIINLFDTMIGAGILGRPNLGLGSLLSEEFNIVLDKKNQRANWGRRPLPANLLNYAQLDTHFLIELRNRQRDELIRKDLWPLAQEDFERLAKLVPKQTRQWSQPDKENGFWRVNGSCDLTPQNAAVLKELCLYRDSKAQEFDRPPFKVVNNNTLLEIAERTPRDQSELRNIPGMSSRMLEQHAKGILVAVNKGMESDPVFRPVRKRPDGSYLRRRDQLKQWRKQTARERGVKSDVILPRDLLQDIASQNPQDLNELKDVMADVPWRFTQFGELILSALNH